MEVHQETTAVSDTVHDFLNERLVFKVIGCYNILRTSRAHFLINVAFLACTFALYMYTFSMCVYSLTLPDTDPAFKVQVCQILSVMNLVVVVPSLSVYYRRNYRSALRLLESGFDSFLQEDPDETHARLRAYRVRQIRFWSFMFTVLCYLAAVFYTLRPPFMFVLGSGTADASGPVNPYLPLPFYVPFDTRTPLGFTVAFLSNVLYLFLWYTILTCFTETYLSSALQLLAQIEIFNYSLRNIQNRAATKFKSKKTNNYRLNTSEDRDDIQNSLYGCLKISLQHHQAILRYHHEIKEYLGAMNTICLLVFALIFATSIVTVIQDPLGNIALIIQLVIELSGYFQLFLVGQLISDESTNTINSLYSTPWTDYNKSYNIMLNIMLTFAKKPIILRAPLLNTDWTLETFGVMLSGAYKLVNVLLNTV